MASPVEFHIERSWVLLSKWGGLACGALALGILASPLFDPEVEWWLAVPGGAVFLAMALWSLRVGYRSERYSIELSQDGIRVPLQGRWAPWSQLSRLVERPLLQRVDILDQGGARFASLEYQLARLPEALERILAGIPHALPQQDVFRPRLLSGRGLVTMAGFATMAALGAVLWLYAGEPSGLLLEVVVVGVLAFDALTEVWSVRFLRDGLAIRRGPRRKLVPWDQIARVEFALRQVGHGHQLLDVFVVRTGGARERIRPQGCDPFLLQACLAKRIQQERGSGH